MRNAREMVLHFEGYGWGAIAFVDFSPLGFWVDSLEINTEQGNLVGENSMIKTGCFQERGLSVINHERRDAIKK